MRRLLKSPPQITVTSEAIAAWLDQDAHRRAAETTLRTSLADYYNPLEEVHVNSTGPYRVYVVVRHNDDKLLVIAAPADAGDLVGGARFYFAVELDDESNTWRRIGHIVAGESDEDPCQVYCMIMGK